ncbi:MAG: hypothetical protein HY273_15345 [Gammaproteobacteria bacterium]|nr:hypothetical protein [Gammaproteobacteria bacterium]
MKIRKGVTAFMLFVGTLLVPASAYALTQQCSALLLQGVTNGQEINVAKLLGKTPIAFVPFDTIDMIDWIKAANNEKIYFDAAPNEIVLLDYQPDAQGVSTLVEVARGNVDAWLLGLNEVEKEINTYGFSLRDTDINSTLDIWEIYNDPTILRNQILNTVRARATEQAKQCADSIKVENCPQIDLNYLVAKYPKIKPNDKVNLPNGDSITVTDLVYVTNNSAKIACSLGFGLFDMIDGLLVHYENDPGNPASPPHLAWGEETLADFTNALSGGVTNLLRKLGYQDDLSNPLGLAALMQPIENVVGKIQDQVNNLVTATREKLEKLKLEAQQVVTALKIPAIPSYPAPIAPKYPDLKIRKKKEWPGFNVGNEALVAGYGNAYYEIYGSEKAQAAVAYGVMGAKILHKDICMLGGTADFFVGLTSEANVLGRGIPVTATAAAYAILHFQSYGFNWDYQNINATDLAIKYAPAEPLWKYGYKVGYTQQFMIGPVPVSVTLGAQFSTGIKMEAGVGPMRLYGQAEPFAQGDGYAEGAVGIKGVVSAGAGAKLLLLSASVPLRGSAELLFSGKGEPYIALAVTSNATFRTLDGRVYAFAEYYVPRFGVPPWKKKSVTKTLFQWAGYGASLAIMNWGMEVGYHGAKMKGELLDQVDLDEGAALNNAILAIDRANELANYATATNQKLATVFTAVSNDLALPAHQRTTFDAQMVKNYRGLYDANVNTYLCVLAATAAGTTPVCL